jgi:excisionase family DNA binding protein
MSDHGQVMTIKDVAFYLHIHSSTVHRLLKRGELPAFKIGGCWRFFETEIYAWMRKRTEVPR